MEFRLVNGTVFDAVNPEPQQIDVKIKDGKIAEIGNYTDGEKIDVSGMKLFPGLVEAHCHPGLAGWANRCDGSDYNETSDCVTPELNAIDAFNPLDETVRAALEGGDGCILESSTKVAMVFVNGEQVV